MKDNCMLSDLVMLIVGAIVAIAIAATIDIIIAQIPECSICGEYTLNGKTLVEYIVCKDCTRSFFD